MKATSLRYLDAKFHHPSLGASPKLKKNTNGRLAIPALVGLLVSVCCAFNDLIYPGLSYWGVLWCLGLWGFQKKFKPRDG